MKKRYLPFTVPNWFILSGLGLTVVVFIVLGYCLILYYTIQTNKVDGFEHTKELVVEETDIEIVNHISRYHGNLFYHVVRGETKVGEDAIAFVPVEGDDSIKYFVDKGFMTKEQARQYWNTNCSNCELIGINLAIDQNHPLWEIKYIDDKDRYVFEYLSLENGSSYEQFRLKRSLY